MDKLARTLFKAKAEALFIRANPTAIVTGWVQEPRHIKYPTGVKGIVGKFHAVARGFAPKVVTADYDEQSGWMVR